MNGRIGYLIEFYKAWNKPDKAYENNNRGLYRLKVKPLLDPLRDDPRFGELLRQMNIPE